MTTGWAAVAAEAAPAGPATGLEYASAGRRLGAYIIDAVIVGTLAYFVTLPVWLPVMTDPTWAYDMAANPDAIWEFYQSPAWILAGVGSTVLHGLYFVLSWRLMRGSPGQRAVGLYLGDLEDGQPLPWGRATLRWLALTWGPLVALVYLIPWPGWMIATVVLSLLVLVWQVVLLISVSSNPRRQGLHDRWARSLIVRRAPLTG